MAMHEEGELLERDHGEEIALASSPVASLCAGYDQVLSALRSSAVKATERSDGAEAKVRITVAEGMVEMSSAIEVDQSLSVSYLGIAGVDQKMKFVSNQKATSTSVSIVAYARKTLGSSTATNPVLTVDLNGKTTADFVRAYGDSYVDSISEGGEYYGVYTFYTETTEQQQSLVASLKANGIYSGVSASAELNVKIDNYVKTTNTSWTFDQQVTGLSNPDLPNPDQMVDYAVKFPDRTLDAPKVIGFSTASYDHVPGFTLPFAQIVINREYFVGNSIDGGLTEQLVDLVELQNKIDWLKAIYACYGYKGDTELDAFATLVAQDRAKIAAQFSAYEADPTQSFTRPALPSLDKGTPVLSFDKLYTEMWGGGGGGPFEYPRVEDALANQTRLTWLRLRSGSRIDRISLRYTDIHGEGAVQNHGGDGGSDQPALSLDSNESVVTVNGRSGSEVDNLQIVTNRGSSTQGGGDGGHADAWKCPDGYILLGFQGRSGSRLDAIQMVAAKLNPATYDK